MTDNPFVLVELTYEQWQNATPKEKAEYFKWLVSQIEFDEYGYPNNLEWYFENDKCFRTKELNGYNENIYYRIKPTPKYRQFNDIAEFIPHVDRWFKWDNEPIYRRVSSIDYDRQEINSASLKLLFDRTEFVDLATGKCSPFGVEVVNG